MNSAEVDDFIAKLCENEVMRKAWESLHAFDRLRILKSLTRDGSYRYPGA